MLRRSRDGIIRSNCPSPACGVSVSAILLLAIYLNGTLAKVMLSVPYWFSLLVRRIVILSRGRRAINFRITGQCIYSDKSGYSDGCPRPLQSWYYREPHTSSPCFQNSIPHIPPLSTPATRRLTPTAQPNIYHTFIRATVFANTHS
jgi:hypothetical protein